MKVLKKWQCSIERYPTEIQISAKRRPKYYKTGEAPPKKYGGVFYPDKEGYLLDDSGEKILKNTKTANKPRFITINANHIYVGVHNSIRSKIVNSMHEMLGSEFKKQFPSKIDIPDGCKILVHLHFYDIYTSRTPDLDNLSNLFIKTGIDCLTELNNKNQKNEEGETHKLGIIKDDKIIFIPGIAAEYTCVSTSEERKLNFNLYLIEDGFKIEDCLDKELEK